ncbi:uncharacterized protein PHALS_11221 [Plasmopara halstedii]|uniref:Uncharacterized protein n=1 Tax=Plasmopara halstedii TaxID=4781 RepID=A0A0P1AJC8_PLAHL|nr:uncharacterized protein PHALS_11221 [Plasmopara halstedii]CEG41052.1 hypothetical protein PHALS_11221 [Plasmopara halstedii]|eukprot:XP_024577421.1 hypothetical protein PHALS_11221 [Plasmopara halstedii]
MGYAVFVSAVRFCCSRGQTGCGGARTKGTSPYARIDFARSVMICSPPVHTVTTLLRHKESTKPAILTVRKGRTIKQCQIHMPKQNWTSILDVPDASQMSSAVAYMQQQLKLHN